MTSTALREDQAQISDVLIRYATGIDQCDWQLFRTCWTTDIVADYGSFGQFTNVETITEAMTRSHEKLASTHHRMSNLVIDIDGDQATARSYVHAVLMLDTDDPTKWIETIGHYNDTLIRTSKGWQITTRTSVTTRMLTSGNLS